MVVQQKCVVLVISCKFTTNANKAARKKVNSSPSKTVVNVEKMQYTIKSNSSMWEKLVKSKVDTQIPQSKLTTMMKNEAAYVQSYEKEE